MDTIATKDLLHLRIEQADEKLLAVLAELTESLFRSYQPEAVEDTAFVAESQEEAAKMAALATSFQPMRKAEFYAEVNASIAEYQRGGAIALEEADKEAAT